MPSIPLFFQAKQVAVMSVVPEVVDVATGNLTDGTAVNVKALGIFDSLMGTLDNGLFEVSNSDAGMENYQDAKATFNFRLGTLDKAGKVNAVMDLFMGGSGYVKIVAQGTLGNAGQKVLTLWAKTGTLDTGYVEQKNMTVITLRPCGIAPTWAAPD